MFRTAEVGDVFTDDLFLDGHPPFWRFQIQGVDTFAAWLQDYSPAARPAPGRDDADPTLSMKRSPDHARIVLVTQ